MDSLEIFKYFAVAAIGFFLGRITMAFQYAKMKPKSEKPAEDLNMSDFTTSLINDGKSEHAQKSPADRLAIFDKK